MARESQSAQDLRRKRLILSAWAPVLSALGAGASLALLSGWPRIAISVLFGVLFILTLVAIAILQGREGRQEGVEQLEALLQSPIKRVNDLDADEVGVAPESPDALIGIGRSDGVHYLQRDIDGELDWAIDAALDGRTASLVVLSGISKAGKTRAMFEAMQRRIPDAKLIAPADADAIDELVKPGALRRLDGDVAVLWLDDLEQYLKGGSHGMHPGVLERLSDRDRKFVVLATAGGKGARLAGDDASQFSVPMEKLLQHRRTCEIWLSSELSADEVERLRSYAPDAAERIAREGIGEYMITAEELERKLDSGRHHGGPISPHGQAVAYAAVDWQRAGIVDPIPRAVLRDVYGSYLPETVNPSDEGFEEGLEWALRPLYSTVALLSGRNDEFSPYDHIVAYVESSLNREIDETAWLRFLDAATDEQAFELANGAYYLSQADPASAWSAHAERAIRQAMISDDPSLEAQAAHNLSVLLIERGDPGQREEALRLTEEARFQPEAMSALAGRLVDQGALGAAVDALRRAEKMGEPGASHLLGDLLGNRLDEPEEAIEAYLRAEEAGDGKAAIARGTHLHQARMWTEAEAAYRRGEELDEPMGAFLLALLLDERDRWDEAEEAFLRAEQGGVAKAKPYLETLRERNRREEEEP